MAVPFIVKKLVDIAQPHHQGAEGNAMDTAQDFVNWKYNMSIIIGVAITYFASIKILQMSYKKVLSEPLYKA